MGCVYIRAFVCVSMGGCTHACAAKLLPLGIKAEVLT